MPAGKEAGRSDTTSAAQWDDTDPATDRTRYGGAPGCARCDATLAGPALRLDLNAGAPNNWHGSLCGPCVRELVFWLRDPTLMILGGPTPVLPPVPRSRHQ